MCWGKEIAALRQLVRLAVVLALGALTAACFQPLYGNQTLAARRLGSRQARRSRGAQTFRPLTVHPESRLAVELRNKLMFDFNGGASAAAPIYRLQVTSLNSSIQTVIVDVTSGRPDTQVSAVNATFTLTEIATGKVVLNSSTFGRASFDIPGSAQRFAQQRAWLNSEDRAVETISDNIRNRLASFFVAGT